MKAVQCLKYGTPDVIKLVEMPVPVPKDNEILIKVKTTSVEPADCATRSGKPFIIRFFSGLTRPKAIPGTELAGEVAAVGKDVKNFKAGDQIFGHTGIDFGAHAEYTCQPESSAFIIKPPEISFQEAISINDGAATALPFLRDKGKIKTGHKVLINGASGSVGGAAIQLAKYYGAEVTAVCSAVNFSFVKTLGADKVINYAKEDFTKTGKTYDIIFDAVGKNSYTKSRKALKQTGVYMTTVPTLGIMLQMLWRSKRKKKAVFAATGLRKPVEKLKDLNIFTKLTQEGKFSPIIDRVYSFNQIADAHRYVDTERKKGCVVIDMEMKGEIK